MNTILSEDWILVASYYYGNNKFLVHWLNSLHVRIFTYYSSYEGEGPLYQGASCEESKDNSLKFEGKEPMQVTITAIRSRI